MTNKGKYILIMCLLLAFANQLNAQTDSIEYWKNKYMEVHNEQDNKTIITNAQIIGVGSINILDTYLSPEKYSGTDLRYISHTTRRGPDSRWSRQITYQGNIAYAQNRAGSGSEMYGIFNFSYGWHHNWSINDKLILKAGALIDLNLGFLYNTRNGNNPAQAKAYINISPSIEAEYRIKKYTIRYQAAAPFVGLMFSPNYQQSYYDIFSAGDYDHNAVPTTFFTTPSLRQTLSIDVPISKVVLRVGYMGDYQQAKINNLKSHFYTHSIIIGVVKTFSINNLRP